MTAIATSGLQRRRRDWDGHCALASLVEEHGAQRHVVEQHLHGSTKRTPFVAACRHTDCCAVIPGEEGVEVELEFCAAAEFPVSRQTKIDIRRVEWSAEALFGDTQTCKA